MGILRMLCAFLRMIFGSRAALAAENLALRQQLIVLQRSVQHPQIRKSDRVFFVWLSRLWSQWRSALLISRSGSSGLRRGLEHLMRRGDQHPAVVGDGEVGRVGTGACVAISTPTATEHEDTAPGILPRYPPAQFSQHPVMDARGFGHAFEVPRVLQRRDILDEHAAGKRLQFGRKGLLLTQVRWTSPASPVSPAGAGGATGAYVVEDLELRALESARVRCPGRLCPLLNLLLNCRHHDLHVPFSVCPRRFYRIWVLLPVAFWWGNHILYTIGFEFKGNDERRLAAAGQHFHY